jgi:hypothetical protein
MSCQNLENKVIYYERVRYYETVVLNEIIKKPLGEDWEKKSLKFGLVQLITHAHRPPEILI